MRYRFAALMVLAVLPVMPLLAAPAPDPSAILDIGPPPKGKTTEEHYQTEIDQLTRARGLVRIVCRDPEVCKLPSIAALKDERDWLVKNLRLTQQGEGNRLRLTFRAGTGAEQAVILNAFLRVYVRLKKERLKFHEKGLRSMEADLLQVEKRLESGQYPQMVDSYREGINDLRSTRIPACRAEIARLKKVAVIRWAN